MPEPGKANLWKSWVRWVTIGLAACFVLSIFLMPVAAMLIQVTGAPPTLIDEIVGFAITLFLAAGVAGTIWSYFVAPPLRAGDLRHLRWQDTPRKLGASLAIAPMVPAIICAAVAVGMPSLTMLLIWSSGGPGMELNWLIVWVTWTAPIAIALCLVGYPIRLLTQRRFRRTIAAAHICFKCGYNLRGTTSGACPECGEPIPALPG
ncbi:MAG: hypothetical protein AAGB29_11080 [Planctomycetota bacterium]